jgi:hypothetical protein
MSSDPHDEPHNEPHDALHALPGAADPAPSGRAVGGDPASLETVMSEITNTQTATDDRARSWWALGPAVATAAAAVLAVLVLGGVWWVQRTPVPASAPGPVTAAEPATGGVSASAPAPVMATITLADATQDLATSCMRPEPALIHRAADLALAGTVREASATSATVDVDRWYRGGSGRTRVIVNRPADHAPGILYTPELAVGQRVLLVATDGALHVCDPSGPWSAEGEALYVAAFGPGTPVPSP